MSRIVERGVGRLRAEFGSQPRDLTAAIGPGIGRCCYSVGEEVRMEFTSRFGCADSLLKKCLTWTRSKKNIPCSSSQHAPQATAIWGQACISI